MDHNDFPSATSTLLLDSSQDNLMDIDFVQLFLDGGCWIETTAADQCCNNTSASGTQFNFLSPTFQTNNNNNNNNNNSDNTNNRLAFDDESVPNSSQAREPADTLNLWGNPPQPFDDFLSQAGNQLNKSWWIPPVPKTIDSTDPLSVQRRLAHAITRFRDSTKDRNLLIQMWVPTRSEGKNVLTTTGQPFTVDPDCKSLEYYRNVSEHYQFPAEENSKESVGLPGRVYLNKTPEWTPDVKLFKVTEYPRISYAHQYNVQGSIALPVFERGSGNCLGVVEIVTTTRNINYRSDLEQARKALEAFDFRSTEICSPCRKKDCNESYQLASPDIVEVLTSICRTHKLPLAQTWVPCGEHSKDEILRSHTNHNSCFRILDSAFYAADPQNLEFHEACSDHNLYKGQGVVGEAFTTEKPCFEADVTRYTKTEYPLSHHAKTFGLRAAVAVRIQSVHSVWTDFVLEFFLPTDCHSKEAQRKMLVAMSSSLQQAGQNLRTLTGLELKEDVLLPVKEAMLHARFSTGSKQKGKGVSAVYKKEPEEEFNVTMPLWDNFEKETLRPQQLHDFERRLQDSARKDGVTENGGDSSSLTAQRSSGSRRTGEKRRTKTEKTISLQVLRQYFAGSLKDAAKNIGVCPTTLKRICRQHGITRWPSRKIKKVGHSLRKIQMVIDSVQGAEGALQIGNFYTSYPELSSPNVPQPDHQLRQPNLIQQEDNVALFSLGGTSSKSPSSSCSQSSSSGLCCSSGQAPTSNDLLLGGEKELVLGTGQLKRARSDAQLHAAKQEERVAVLARAQSQKALLGQHGSFGKRGGPGSFGYKVKAAYGEEKVRFSLQEKWGFREVEEEIRNKFNLNVDEISRMDIKYLDDDSEWVLLTCDDDLEECIDIFKSCKRRTIKMCVQVKCQSNIGSSYGSFGRLLG